MTKVLRDPRIVLPAFFAERHPGFPLLLKFVLPWAAVRGLALVARGVIAKSVGVGIVLGVGGWFLQWLTWLGLSLALPPLARTLKYSLNERHAMGLAAVTCAPLFVAGILLAVPEEPAAPFYLSRVAVGLIAAYGVRLLRLAMTLLPIPQASIAPLWAASAGSFALIYGVFFVLVGVAANVVLFVCGLGA